VYGSALRFCHEAPELRTLVYKGVLVIVHDLDVPACRRRGAGFRPGFGWNMRNLLMAIVVVFMSWMHNAQAQSATVDPESIVPLPNKFDMEVPAPDVPSEIARFHGAWIGHGTTTGISSWSSASNPMGMRT
jgi:hypothetical protein